MLKKAKIVVLIIAIIATATIPVLVGAKSSEKAKQDFANVIFFAYFRGDTEGKEYRNKGYASKLLKSLCGNYKQKYEKMLVGTTENNIPFYVKQGFDTYEKTIKNYFIDNYDEEIKDGSLICTDLIYYSKNLNKKM